MPRTKVFPLKTVKNAAALQRNLIITSNFLAVPVITHVRARITQLSFFAVYDAYLDFNGV